MTTGRRCNTAIRINQRREVAVEVVRPLALHHVAVQDGVIEIGEVANFVSQGSAAGAVVPPRAVPGAASVFSGIEVRDVVTPRPADNGGLNTFVGLLRMGKKDEEVAANIAGSGEYFGRL